MRSKPTIKPTLKLPYARIPLPVALNQRLLSNSSLAAVNPIGYYMILANVQVLAICQQLRTKETSANNSMFASFRKFDIGPTLFDQTQIDTGGCQIS